MYTCEIPDVEAALGHFTNTLLDVIDKHAPLKKFRIVDRSNSWFTTELSLLFKERDKAWSLARRTDQAADWLKGYFNILANSPIAIIAIVLQKGSYL